MMNEYLCVLVFVDIMFTEVENVETLVTLVIVDTSEEMTESWRLVQVVVIIQRQDNVLGFTSAAVFPLGLAKNGFENLLGSRKVLDRAFFTQRSLKLTSISPGFPRRALVSLD